MASKWFDYNNYMASKLVQLQKAEPAANWTMDTFVKAFAAAGFDGADGAEKHFTEYGQHEGLAPNAFFNGTEYYRAKAADYYGYTDPKKVTDLDVANIKKGFDAANMSAWQHYKMYGNAEGVNPSNGFDTDAYMQAKVDALNSIKDGKQYTLTELKAEFQKMGLSALEHFMLYGGSGAGEVAQEYKGTIPDAFAVPENKKVVSGGGSEGKTFVLTKEIDTIIGTSGNDTILGDFNSDTVQVGDSIDGGSGDDTLVLYMKTATDKLPVSIKNVEHFVLDGLVANTQTINVSSYADMKDLTLRNHATDTGATVVTMGANQGLKLEKVTTGSNHDVTIKTASGVKALGPVTFNEAGTSAAKFELGIDTGATGLKTLDIATTGNASFVELTDLKAVETLNIKATADLTAKISTFTSDKLTVDGSASTAKLTLDVSAAKTFAITGGKADDRFDFGDELKAGDKVNGGDGADTIVVSTAVSSGAGNLGDIAALLNDKNNFSSIEVLELSAALTGAGGDTLSASAFKAINQFKLAGGHAAAVDLTSDALAISSIETGDSFIFSGVYTNASATNSGGGASASADGTSANDMVSFTASEITGLSLVLDDAQFTAQKGLGASGASWAPDGGDAFVMGANVSSLSINSIGDAKNVIIGGAGGNNASSDAGAHAGDGGDAIDVGTSGVFKVTITGTQDLDILGGAGGTAASSGNNGHNGNGFTTSVEVDAKLFEGKLNIQGSHVGDTIYAGKGDDTIRTGAGIDAVNLTAGGKDTVILDQITDNNQVKITGFDVADDKFGLDKSDLGINFADASGVLAASAFKAGSGNALTLTANAVNVITTSTGFADYDAAFASVKAPASGTGLVAFYNTTSGKAEIYYDGSLNTDAGEVLIAQVDIAGTDLANIGVNNFSVIA